MMTIDEVIAHEREGADIARGNIIKCNNIGGYESWHNSECIKRAEEHEQIAEWLEELKAYKSDEFTKNLQELVYKQGYNKAIDDFAEKLKSECRIHYVDCDPYFGGITDSILYKDDIEEIAEQLKEGGKND